MSKSTFGMRQALDTVIVLVGVPISFSLLAGMYGAQNFEFMVVATQSIGLGRLGFVIAGVIAGLLYAADNALESYNGRFTDELYGLVKDIGEQVKSGLSIEAAMQKSTEWKSSPAASRFKEALLLARDAPLEAALRRAAESSGQPAFRETATLMAGAIDAGGDVGPALRWLAAHFGRLRQHEREFTSQLNGALVTMRAVALVAAPLLYRGLEWSLAGHDGAAQTTLSPATVTFFAWGAVCMASLDGLVYGMWTRVPAKVPVYIAISRTFLGIW